MGRLIEAPSLAEIVGLVFPGEDVARIAYFGSRLASLSCRHDLSDGRLPAGWSRCGLAFRRRLFRTNLRSFRLRLFPLVEDDERAGRNDGEVKDVLHNRESGGELGTPIELKSMLVSTSLPNRGECRGFRKYPAVNYRPKATYGLTSRP